MGLLDLFKKKGSSDVAKDRLKLLLVSDRANCSPYPEILKNPVVSVEHPILIEDYQRKRIVDFIEGNKSEEVDMTDAGTYQQAYAVQAIGSGQLYGKGLNNNDTSSLKNAGYIAEAQNDFIFAVKSTIRFR